jgi:hypothetical protein
MERSSGSTSVATGSSGRLLHAHVARAHLHPTRPLTLTRDGPAIITVVDIEAASRAVFWARPSTIGEGA